MSRAATAAALAALAAAVWPTPAQAAYSPTLDVRVDPATPSVAAAVTTTLTQEPGESPNRTEVIRYPPDFRFNPGFAVTGCRPEDEEAEACPEASRIGTASAETELGSFAGPVHLSEDFRVLIFLRGPGGVIRSKVVGVFRVRPDGSVETVLDDLAPVRSTFAQVRLEAGPRSLILTPARCGSYPIEGRFVSHQGEVATSTASVVIAGCDTAPAIAALSARARRGRIDAGWTLTADGARSVLTLERSRATRAWDRWERVASARTSARKGRNLFALRPPRGRPLPPGLYRLTVAAFSARGRLSDMRRTQFRIRR